MRRRGEVPDGWVQLEKWPLQSRQKPTPAVRQSGVVKRAHRCETCNRSSSACESDFARVTAQERARKLEKALEVMSDMEEPVVEAIRVELQKAQNAAAVPTLDVQVQQCESFISRSLVLEQLIPFAQILARCGSSLACRSSCSLSLVAPTCRAWAPPFSGFGPHCGDLPPFFWLGR